MAQTHANSITVQVLQPARASKTEEFASIHIATRQIAVVAKAPTTARISGLVKLMAKATVGKAHQHLVLRDISIVH